MRACRDQEGRNVDRATTRRIGLNGWQEATGMLSTRTIHPIGRAGWLGSGSSANEATTRHCAAWAFRRRAGQNEAACLSSVEEIVRAARLAGSSGSGRRCWASRSWLSTRFDRRHTVLRRLVAEYPELSPITLAKKGVQGNPQPPRPVCEQRGQWIATLDADLQNDPADLAVLWQALPGFDAALGWRATRRDVWSKRLISRLANRIRNRVLGQSIRDTGCSVRIFSRERALRLPLFHGWHRFLGPLLLRDGARLTQLPVSHRPRPHGRSHYNLWNRSLRVVVDLFGVAWLLRRPIRYEVVGNASEPAVASPHFQAWQPAGR